MKNSDEQENEFTRTTGFKIGVPYGTQFEERIIWMTFHAIPLQLKNNVLIKTVAVSPSYVHKFNGRSFVIPQTKKGMIQYLN